MYRLALNIKTILQINNHHCFYFKRKIEANNEKLTKQNINYKLERNLLQKSRKQNSGQWFHQNYHPKHN